MILDSFYYFFFLQGHVQWKKKVCLKVFVLQSNSRNLMKHVRESISNFHTFLLVTNSKISCLKQYSYRLFYITKNQKILSLLSISCLKSNFWTLFIIKFISTHKSFFIFYAFYVDITLISWIHFKVILLCFMIIFLCTFLLITLCSW